MHQRVGTLACAACTRGWSYHIDCVFLPRHVMYFAIGMLTMCAISCSLSVGCASHINTGAALVVEHIFGKQAFPHEHS